MGRFSRLFIHNSRFGSDVDVDDDMSRDLFYGVACATGSFTRHCSNWTMYMTGTNLSISKLKAEKGVSSFLLRNKIEEVPITSSLLTKGKMKDMLQYYWDLSDDIFTEAVMNALDQFRGRPYFFVKYVFMKIYIDSMKN